MIYHNEYDSAILPSWVPAWHHGRNSARDPPPFDAYADADDGEPPKCYILPANQDVVGVQGRPVGTVSAVGGLFETDQFSGLRLLNVLQEVRALCEDVAAKSSVLVGGVLSETDVQIRSSAECLAAFENFENKLRSGQEPLPRIDEGYQFTEYAGMALKYLKGMWHD